VDEKDPTKIDRDAVLRNTQARVNANKRREECPHHWLGNSD